MHDQTIGDERCRNIIIFESRRIIGEEGRSVPDVIVMYLSRLLRLLLHLQIIYACGLRNYGIPYQI